MPKTHRVYPRHVQLLPINLPVQNTVCRCTDVVTLIQNPYNLKSVFPRIVAAFVETTGGSIQLELQCIGVCENQKETKGRKPILNHRFVVGPHKQVDGFVTKNEIEELRIFLRSC
jgi:hypothetical protein